MYTIAVKMYTTYVYYSHRNVHYNYNIDAQYQYSDEHIY